MILGIGNDILEIGRMEEAIKKEGFLFKYFTELENKMFVERHFNPGTIGGNYSVKEAVSKAIGTGVRNFSLKDVEVLRDDLGKPYVNLYNQASVISKEKGITHWHVSISHSKTFVTAFAIGEGQ